VVIRPRLLLRRAALLAGLAAALGAIGAAPAPALTIGIADQKPDMFSDPRFLASGIHYARRAVPWDALTSPSQTATLDAWMNGARAAGVLPLISFTHSSVDRRALPSPERLLYEFRRFRTRYPWVTDFASWNEANHCGEPTCHRPELVAAYWRKLRRACPSCRVLAAEVLDMPNMTSWVKAFRRAAKVEPRYWGLHNYIDANRLRTTGTRRLLKAVKGQVWFTETGGIVSRTNRRRVTFPESASHAAIATRFLFDRLVPLSPRITRVYLYHWNSEPGPKTWDSALIGPTGQPRPAYGVLQHELRLRAAAKLARSQR
jgi:polysaccharide biosynthesis protein PslG